MKIFKFLLSLALTVGLIFVMGKPLDMEGTSIPPIGSFFSPFSGFWQNAESNPGFKSEQLEFPEMKGEVKIMFDERLVPHIFADNLEDAIFAQGYVTAKYRLWQMDMLSRASSGRLSEIMGENLLETDKLMRRKGMLYGAKKAEESWRQSPETYPLLEAYTRGVNAWISNLPEAKNPLEFKLLNYQPENWSVLKMALIKKYMDLTLCSAETDLESSNALQVFGPELFQKLYPEWNPKQAAVIPGNDWDFPPMPIEKPQMVEEAIGLIDHDVFEKQPEFIGSNNWAVSGSKTASGNPILCNDPHLRLSLPSIWFELQIHTPETNVYGVSIPGMPGVIIGFNEHTAWGVTNVGQDVTDWYRIAWTDDTRTTYQLDGGLKQAKLITEKYFVKGSEDPVLDTVRWTVWGPIVYEGKDNPRHDLAMRWIAHDAPNPNDFQCFLGLDRGKTYEDYRQALRHYEFPGQNFAFASKTGDIAMTVNGRFPMKKDQQGRFVQDGSLSANAWSGYIPKEQVPHMKNPDRGFVASANQHSTEPSYPYYFNSRGFDDYRGRYLVDQLGKMQKISAEDMQRLQNSNYSILAEEGLTGLLSLIDLNSLSEREKDVVNKLAVWNFEFDADKVEPAIFENWWSNFYEMTFDEVYAWRDSIPILMPDNWRLVDFLETAGEDEIFDDENTPEIETAKQIAHASLKQTCDEMADQLVDSNFDWASHKSTSIMHLARIPAFSEMNLDVGGNKQALNALSKFHGPSWRMIVELGEDVKGWGIFPGGQSGNPGSHFYSSGIEKWSKGEYNSLFFMKNENDESQPTLFSIEIN